MEESGDSPEKDQELAEAVHYVVWLSELARREGLLELGEEIGASDKPFVKQELWPMMDLVIAGAHPDIIERICLANYFSVGRTGYDGLRYLIFFWAAMDIQDGIHPRVLEEELVAMLPKPCRVLYKAMSKRNPPYEAGTDDDRPWASMLSQEEIRQLLSKVSVDASQSDKTLGEQNPCSESSPNDGNLRNESSPEDGKPHDESSAEDGELHDESSSEDGESHDESSAEDGNPRNESSPKDGEPCDESSPDDENPCESRILTLEEIDRLLSELPGCVEILSIF